MTLQWSLTDPMKGARSVKEITEKAQLPKKSKVRFNCCQKPIFSFIPMEHVTIDNLHLFLRISDVLINLLIRDIRVIDGIEKATGKLPDNSKGKNLLAYQEFLNGPCKIRFNWYIDEQSKKLSWRDLTGPEKIRLFKEINIPTLFPTHNRKEQLQALWTDFYSLIKKLGESHCEDIDEFEKSVKSWVIKFTELYQTKDVTLYIHAFSMHVPQFLRMYGNISVFTQQGLEKLNDFSTKFYQRSSNHRTFESLQQILEKHNRLEILESNGCQRTKKIQKCSVYKCIGHNKRCCPEKTSM